MHSSDDHVCASTESFEDNVRKELAVHIHTRDQLISQIKETNAKIDALETYLSIRQHDDMPQDKATQQPAISMAEERERQEPKTPPQKLATEREFL